MVKPDVDAEPVEMRREGPVLRLIPSAAVLAVLIAVLGAATVGAAWGVEWAGYIPCELCLDERVPYYLGVPLALVAAGAAWSGWRRVAVACSAALTLVLLVGAGLGAYHAGVEWALWPGPSGCSGPPPQATTVTDFMAALRSQHPVRCDAPALTVLGLSLAAWNALVSLGLAALAGLAAYRARAVHRAPFVVGTTPASRPA